MRRMASLLLAHPPHHLLSFYRQGFGRLSQLRSRRWAVASTVASSAASQQPIALATPSPSAGPSCNTLAAFSTACASFSTVSAITAPPAPDFTATTVAARPSIDLASARTGALGAVRCHWGQWLAPLRLLGKQHPPVCQWVRVLSALVRRDLRQQNPEPPSAR